MHRSPDGRSRFPARCRRSTQAGSTPRQQRISRVSCKCAKQAGTAPPPLPAQYAPPWRALLSRSGTMPPAFLQARRTGCHSSCPAACAACTTRGAHFKPKWNRTSCISAGAQNRQTQPLPFPAACAACTTRSAHFKPEQHHVSRISAGAQKQTDAEASVCRGVIMIQCCRRMLQSRRQRSAWP